MPSKPKGKFLRLYGPKILDLYLIGLCGYYVFLGGWRVGATPGEKKIWRHRESAHVEHLWYFLVKVLFCTLK